MRGQIKFNYIGSFDYRGSPLNDCALLATYPQGCRIGSNTTTDITLSYSGIKNWRIFGSVLNVLDTKAPLDLTYTQNYDYNYHSIVGRFFNVGATYAFK